MSSLHIFRACFFKNQKICSPGQVWKSLPDWLGSEAGEDRNNVVLFCSDQSISRGNLLSSLPVSILTCGDAGRHWGQEEITSKCVLPTSCWLFPPSVSSACSENKQTKIASYIPAISHQNPSGRVGFRTLKFWVLMSFFFSLWSHIFLFSFPCSFPNFSKECLLAKEIFEAWDVQGTCTTHNNKGSLKCRGWERETSACCASEIAASFDSHRGDCSYFIRLHFPNCNLSLICSQGFNHKFSTARVSNPSSSSSLSLSPTPRKKNHKGQCVIQKKNISKMEQTQRKFLESVREL